VNVTENAPEEAPKGDVEESKADASAVVETETKPAEDSVVAEGEKPKKEKVKKKWSFRSISFGKKDKTKPSKKEKKDKKEDENKTVTEEKSLEEAAAEASSESRRACKSG
jgi:hypothetical protein